MNFWIDVTDENDNALGSAPIRSAVRWDSETSLNQISRHSFFMPANDENASLIAPKNRAHCYTLIGGVVTWVGGLIIDDLEYITTGNTTVLNVSGNGIEQELTWRSVKNAQVTTWELTRAEKTGHGLGFVRIINDSYSAGVSTPSGWTETANANAYGGYQHEKSTNDGSVVAFTFEGLVTDQTYSVYLTWGVPSSPNTATNIVIKNGENTLYTGTLDQSAAPTADTTQDGQDFELITSGLFLESGELTITIEDGDGSLVSAADGAFIASSASFTPVQLTNTTDASTSTYDRATFTDGQYWYIGSANKFAAVAPALTSFAETIDGVLTVTQLGFNQQNAGIFSAQYWDGSAWSGLNNFTDGTAKDGATMRVSGGRFSFSIPSDWATTTVMSSNIYWIRIKFNALLDPVNITDVQVATKKLVYDDVSTIGALFPSPWVRDTGYYVSTALGVDRVFNGESVWEALSYLARVAGERFRVEYDINAGTYKVQWLRSDSAASGVRAIKANGATVAATDRTELCQVGMLRKLISTYDQPTRVYPFGAGYGDATVTLSESTATMPSGYTMDTANNYIAIDPEPTKRRERWVQFPEIVGDEFGVKGARESDRLAAIAQRWLAARKDSKAIYELGDVTGLEQIIKVGDSLHLDYVEIENEIEVHNIKGDFDIISISLSLSQNGIRVNSMTITDGVWTPSDDPNLLAELYQRQIILENTPQPTTQVYIL